MGNKKDKSLRRAIHQAIATLDDVRASHKAATKRLAKIDKRARRGDAVLAELREALSVAQKLAGQASRFRDEVARLLKESEAA